MQNRHHSPRRNAGLLTPCLGAALLLAACGGAGSSADPAALASGASAPGASATSTSNTFTIDAATLPADVATQQATPAFHLAPILLDAPGDIDAVDNSASARSVPHAQAVPAGAQALETRGLTVQAIERAQRERPQAAPRAMADGALAPAASAGVATTYTPAQIRAAYGLPALPVAGAAVSAAQAAQLGAGQTIYIVDAMHDPNAAVELATFNQKFGLPACTTRTIAAGAALPIAAASAAEGCVLSIVFSTPAATMTPTAPAYDAGWATEIALDVQWAHATAPLARIVLIESADASLNGLLGAIKLANAMGPGVVSMSFGGSEGSWTASIDPAFSAAGMSYLAATGDSGSAVSWPAVSSLVLGVGGTSLTYGGGTRSETTWSRTGGGISAYVATPAWQSNAVPGVGILTRRAVADVAFNADPSTGQFVAVLPKGASTGSWVSAGGTSLSTPQWAGLVAVANAMRAQGAKAPLGAPHALLYSAIGTVPGSYAAAFADVATGANGTCATCVAKTGYDTPTGLGTPNASTLLATLSGSATAPAAPVVAATSVAGKSGVALTFTIASTATSPSTFSLAGAPSGMTVAATGIVTWPKPVTGTYAVTATVKDGRTGLSGAGVYTVKIDAPAVAPVVASATVNGKAGVALGYTVSVSGASATGFALAGAPAGMTVSSAGVVAWPNPVAGTTVVTVAASNATSGLSGKGVLTVVIAKAQPPVITAPALSGIAGKALTGSIAVSSPTGSSLSVTISGVPQGVSFSISGPSLLLTWPSPVTGSYALTLVARDSAGATASATLPITIRAK